MNQRLPYEKLIAEKLQDTPVPDEEKTWPRMNAFLDREMPVSENKVQKRTVKKWWWAGGLVVVMVTGVWLSLLFTASKNELVQPQVNNNVSATSQAADDTKSAPDQVYLPGIAPLQSSKKATPEAAGKKAAKVPELGNKPVKKGLSNDRKPALLPRMSPLIGSTRTSLMVPGHELQPFSPASEIENGLNAFTGNAPVTTVLIPVSINNTTANENINIIKYLNDEPPGTLQKSDLAALLPDVHTEKKKLLREMRKHERKEERTLSRSYRTYHSFWGETPDRWFAAGIAPYQNIVIAAQKTYHYNSSAGKNIITDYIPSPYMQLHVTNRIYLQSEFQFNSPQHTAPLLISQRRMGIPSTTTDHAENIYLRKLYYFNLPVSFYYSPLRNFYIGSGLQFSSFSSGLADLEYRSFNNTLMDSETIKLKDDTLSAKFNSSEWRYLFDANYYIGRFIAGFRYNQALSHLIDPKARFIGNAAGTRNQSFQFYIRYNLVVSGRKN